MVQMSTSTAFTSNGRGELLGPKLSRILKLSDEIGLKKRKRVLDGALFNAEAHAQQKQASTPRVVDASMEASFASIVAEITNLPAVPDNGNVSIRRNEEMKAAMQTLQACVSKRFCELIPEGSRFVEHIQNNVLTFCSDDKISRGMGLMVNKLLISFTQWSQDYKDAEIRLQKTTSELSKLDELEEDSADVLNKTEKVVSDEKELRSQLANMESRKQELQEELKAVQDKVADLTYSCEAAAGKMRLLVHRGKGLQTEKDNLRIRFPRITVEQAAAKSLQENIEADWFKLGEMLNEILMSEFGSN